MAEIDSKAIMAEIRGQIVDKPWAENWSRTRVGNVSMEPYHLRTTELLRQQLGEHVGTTVKAAVWVPPVESRDFGVARCAFNLMSAPGDGADDVTRAVDFGNVQTCHATG